MATRKRKEVEGAFSQKGFALYEQADHRYYFFFLNGKQVVRTKVSHGTKYKDLGDDLLTQMARQCKLTKSQFLRLVDCPMSQEEYESTLAPSQE